MDPITLIIGGVALWGLVRKKTSVASPQSGGQGQLATANQTNVNTQGVSPGNFIAAIPLVGGAIATAIAVGPEVDKAINPNSNAFSQTVAGIAVGGTLGLAALAASGLLGPLLLALGVTAIGAWPLVGIFLAVAALTYAIIVVVQDLIRLQYGQAGAREDWAKQFNDIYKQTQDAFVTGNLNVSPVRIQQVVQPFAKGYVARLNWSAYQAWMQQKNIIVSGEAGEIVGQAVPLTDGSQKELFIDGPWVNGIPIIRLGSKLPGTDRVCDADLLWHVNFATDRGYMVANSDGMRPLGQTPTFNEMMGTATADAILRARERIWSARLQDFATETYVVEVGGGNPPAPENVPAVPPPLPPDSY